MSYASDLQPGSSGTSRLAGLKVASVGSGTQIEYVQVHNAGATGIAFLGGTANVRYLVVNGAADESVLYDEGWTGRGQFILVHQFDTLASRSGSAIVGANRRGSSAPGTLNSDPIITNFTVLARGTSIGGGSGLALVPTNLSDSNRTGSATVLAAGRFANGVITGAQNCVELLGTDSGLTTFLRSALLDCTVQLEGEERNFVTSQTNTLLSATSTLNNVFPGPFERAWPATDPRTLGPFFAEASYVGAFSPTETEAANWASGWTVGITDASTGCPAGTGDTGQQAAGGKLLKNGITRDARALTAGALIYPNLSSIKRSMPWPC